MGRTVHMNGRVYDPYTAKFLSADPHVTDPTNGQNYNRYSYVVNNPTNLTDPTGFDINWRWLQITMGWGSSAEAADRKENATANAASASGQRTNSSGTNSNSSKNSGLSVSGSDSGPSCTEGSSADMCATQTNNIVQDRVPTVVVKPDGYVRARHSTFGVSPGDREVFKMFMAGPVNGIPFERPLVWGYRGLQTLRAARAAREVPRVFWSGGEAAKNAAEAWAKANGATTLEMTTKGQELIALTKDMEWAEARPLWVNASKEFAEGAKGEINVFHNANGVSLQSVWREVEYPLLKDSIINYHVVWPNIGSVRVP